MTTSLVILCPVEHLATVTAAGQLLGFAEGEYSVALSPTGEPPWTHYGLHAWANLDIAQAWAEGESLPPLTPEQLAWLRAVLTIAYDPEARGRAFFDEVCASIGVRVALGREAVVVVEEPDA